MNYNIINILQQYRLPNLHPHRAQAYSDQQRQTKRTLIDTHNTHRTKPKESINIHSLKHNNYQNQIQKQEMSQKYLSNLLAKYGSYGSQPVNSSTIKSTSGSAKSELRIRQKQDHNQDSEMRNQSKDDDSISQNSRAKREQQPHWNSAGRQFIKQQSYDNGMDIDNLSDQHQSIPRNTNINCGHKHNTNSNGQDLDEYYQMLLNQGTINQVIGIDSEIKHKESRQHTQLHSYQYHRKAQSPQPEQQLLQPISSKQEQMLPKQQRIQQGNKPQYSQTYSQNVRKIMTPNKQKQKKKRNRKRSRSNNDKPNKKNKGNAELTYIDPFASLQHLKIDKQRKIRQIRQLLVEINGKNTQISQYQHKNQAQQKVIAESKEKGKAVREQRISQQFIKLGMKNSKALGIGRSKKQLINIMNYLQKGQLPKQYVQKLQALIAN